MWNRPCATDCYSVTANYIGGICRYVTRMEGFMLWNITHEMSDIRIKEVYGMRISNTYGILENVECKIMVMAAIKSKITCADICNSARCQYVHGKILFSEYRMERLLTRDL
jgi:hypothetical protein